VFWQTESGSQKKESKRIESRIQEKSTDEGSEGRKRKQNTPAIGLRRREERRMSLTESTEITEKRLFVPSRKPGLTKRFFGEEEREIMMFRTLTEAELTMWRSPKADSQMRFFQFSLGISQKSFPLSMEIDRGNHLSLCTL
jgi:hypothetical protein